MIYNTHTLVHLCTSGEWFSARQTDGYCPPSLDVAGFIHLSAAHQVHVPANLLFAGRHDLVLLCIDPDRVESPIRWEPGEPDDPESMLFPHLYGPLPLEAVVAVERYLPGTDGTFAPLLA
ncbi:DUF952 domain-containing protein [Nocardia sp. 004]|uniref:DUF952 domain-containing protein n=1 Tax=Nocardia sp. 004 TaxID=3385978 RepID=UPI0039A18AA6